MIAALLGGAALALVAGCVSEVVGTQGIGCHLSSPKNLHRIHRLVFVELSCQDAGTPRIAEEMTDALVASLQARRIFHIDVVRRCDSLCQDLPIDPGQVHTLKDLASLRQRLGCDAVLFGKISSFQPHPRMQMGLYLKLLDLKDGRCVWTVDHAWDSTERGTVEQIEAFFETQMREGYDPVRWQLALQSPKAFGKFVAHEVAGTLPARTATAARSPSARSPVLARREGSAQK